VRYKSLPGDLMENENKESLIEKKRKPYQEENKYHENMTPHRENKQSNDSNNITNNDDNKKRTNGRGKLEKIRIKAVYFLKNKWNIAFLIVLILTLLIRLKYVSQESIWNDAAVHLWIVIKAFKDPLTIFSTEYFMSDYATIHTLTLLFYAFTKNLLIAGKTTAILFGMMSIVFMYLLGSELKNKFSGLIAAALLGFHHLFWFYGMRLLADGPLVTMVVIILYCLVKLEKEKTLFWGLCSVLAFFGAMLTKRQGILFFTAFLIYLIIFKRKEMIKTKAILISWLIPVFSFVIGSLVFGSWLIIKYLREWTSLEGLYDPGLKALGHFVWLFSWYLLIPMIFGIFFILIYKKKEYYLSLVCFFLYWIFFELSIRSPEDRYLLPLLPMGILFAVFGLMEVSNYLVLFFNKKKWSNYFRNGLVLILVILICWNFYNIGDPMIDSKSTSYAGHQEAGQWLKENVPEDTPIFVGSPRMQRPFIERDYGGPPDYQRADMGGSLWYLRAPRYLGKDTTRDSRKDPEDPVKGKELFEKDLNELLKKSDVYLEIDIWEYTQPSWYFPINQESVNYFMNLGFELVHVVERDIQTQQGLQKMPVIFLFKKEKIAIND
jgi:hypothetical protein